MSKFEWMELETLSNEITHAQGRLDAARATKNLGLVQLLQREITEVAKRRADVLAGITKGLSRFAGLKPKLVTAPAREPEPTVSEQTAMPRWGVQYCAATLAGPSASRWCRRIFSG